MEDVEVVGQTRPFNAPSVARSTMERGTLFGANSPK